MAACLCSCKHTPIYQPKPDFVRIENNMFMLQNDTFFPLMVNYVVDYRCLNNTFTVVPCIYYEDTGMYETHTQSDNQTQLTAHLQLIKEMGFNTIRVVFDRLHFDENNNPYYLADGQKYYLHNKQKQIIKGLEQFVALAQEQNLKIMLLIKAPFHPQVEKFTIALLKAFKDNNTIFAYDFFNEPLYFDTEKHRSKSELVRIVSHWELLMRKYAPHQLFTLGLSEPIDVFHWDASLLPVDFVQIHTYHPLRVKNEIYWYSTYIHKPWMIGETALPSENDSIPYEHQCQFYDQVYRYARDCGACGFGWWEFQDANIGVFEGKYAGILNHNDTTCAPNGYRIAGSPKPVAARIKANMNYTPQTPQRPLNYYNILGYTNICIKGKIVNWKNEPIEGAVIRGWNSDWSIGMHTFTDSLGNYTLYTNDSCVNFIVSAPGMTRKEFYCQPTYISGPVNYNGPLPMQKLEYHQIDYKNYLLPAAKNIFDINDSLFSTYSIEARMKPIRLRKVQLIDIR